MFIPETVYSPRSDRSDAELQAFIMFCIAVAGKNADNTLRGVNSLMRGWAVRYGEGMPYDWVRKADADDRLAADIKQAGLGCFNYRAAYFRSLLEVNPDLRTATTDELEQVKGVSHKTSRFFILFTRPNVDNIAVLDVHILRFMKSQGFEGVPDTPPSSTKVYKEWERWFIELWNNKFRDAWPTLAEFDYAVWSYMRGDRTNV